ncbi:MAG: integrase, partial [Actinomycetota bacterium]|nr:integrase [Actinomycetota bacterium]
MGHGVIERVTFRLMSGGSIERLPSGRWRAVVRAGRDPITKRYIKLTETCATEGAAIAARERMLAQVEAGSHPDRAATVAVLMERWMDVVDHELSTAETTAGYVRRTINPALGEWTLRKLQHRVDILDRLYKHLGRCNVLCDGRPFVEHVRSDAHDCEKVGCRQHRCKPMAPSTIRRIHAILSSALNYAISWGWIEKNPATYAHPPKLSRRRARPQSPDKVVQLLNA